MARSLHPYRARHGLRAQTCCHAGAPGHNPRPGRRPKISFSPDFAPKGGCHLRAQTYHMTGWYKGGLALDSTELAEVRSCGCEAQAKQPSEGG